MRKITLLSLIVASALFVGCGDDTKKSVAQTTEKAVDATKEAAVKATDAVADASDAVVDTAGKAVDATKEAASDAVDATTKAVVDTKDAVVETAKSTTETATTAVASSADDGAGAMLYAKCAGCHGKDGKTKAMNKSPIIAGLTKEDLVTKIKGYKAGTLNIAGMGTLMKGQVATLNDTEIDQLADYISAL